MKMKDNEYALALREFVFDRIADKEARRELCGLNKNEIFLKSKYGKG